MTDHSALRASTKLRLRAIRDELRTQVRTEPDHAIRHHRADEFLRDALEDVLHEPDDEDAPTDAPEPAREVHDGVRDGLTDGARAEGPAPVTVYVDGSQRANGDGGWAWWVNPGLHRSGAERFTTNNVMELWACIEAIGTFNPDVPLVVVTDSAYVSNCFLERWFDDWRERGWRNSKREPVSNRELWEELIALVDAHWAGVTWVHTRGHGKPGHKPEHRHGNDQADRLAQAASAALSA